jgi:osmotically-inducible protein OsmY
MELRYPLENKTDVQTRNAVETELQWTPGLEASAIAVAVRAGVVELTGEVATLPERYIAVKVTQRIAGVTTVVDQIVVAGQPRAAETDNEIAQRVHATLEWYEALPHAPIRAEVRNGCVTLTGTVEWAYQRKAAQHSVQMLPNVREVINRIGLTPRTFPADTADQIQEALSRQASLAGTTITVHAENGKIMLGGTARTLVQKRDAEQVAWKHPAVVELHNDIDVEG